LTMMSCYGIIISISAIVVMVILLFLLVGIGG